MRFRSLKFVLPAFLLVGAGVTFGVASGDSDNSKATVPTNENAYVSQVAPAKAHATQTWLSVCPATCEELPAPNGGRSSSSPSRGYPRARVMCG